MKKWFDLEGRREDDKLVGKRGTILLHVQWVHSLEVAARKPRKKPRKVDSGEGMVEYSQESEDLLVVDEVSPEQMLEEKKQQEEQQEVRAPLGLR